MTRQLYGLPDDDHMSFNVGKVGQELKADLMAGDVSRFTVDQLIEHALDNVWDADHETAEQVQNDLNQFIEQFGSLMSEGDYQALTEGVQQAFMDTGVELFTPVRQDMSRLSQYGEMTAVFQGQKLLKQAPLHAEPFDRAVQLLQQALQRVSADGKIALVRNGADGRFGPETKAAVMDFQKNFGLGVDGVVGKNTINALNSALKLIA